MACSPAHRDIEEMLLERGLEVDHSTLNRWVPAYAPLIERRLRAFRNQLVLGITPAASRAYSRSKVVPYADEA